MDSVGVGGALWVPLPVTIGINLPDDADPLRAGELVVGALPGCVIPVRAAVAYRPVPAEVADLVRTLGQGLAIAQVAFYPSLLQVLTEADEVDVDHITMLVSIAIEERTKARYGATANAAVNYLCHTGMTVQILQSIWDAEHLWTTTPPPQPEYGPDGWRPPR